MTNRLSFFKRTVCLGTAAALLLLAGCAAGKVPVSLGSAEPVSAGPVSSGMAELTREQRLADYDELWKNIEENYPLMGVAERTTGENFSQVKKEYREQAGKVRSNGEFFSVLRECVGRFSGCGHLSVLDESAYAYALSLYGSLEKQDKRCAYLYGVLNNSLSRAFYRVPKEEDPAASQMRNLPREGNITTAMLRESSAAYVKISTLALENVEHDAPALLDFFKQAEAAGCGSCIIDIRGNSGGSTNYWLQNIVKPNLKKSVAYRNYALVKGEAVRNYLSLSVPLQSVSELPALPKGNRGDLAQMRYCIVGSDKIKPTNKKPAFSGKYYLLTDKQVYSSSEAFALFCKQTGFATIVGDATGGDGVGVDPILFSLPNSGVCFRFSSVLGLNPDGSSNEEFGTQPDLPCERGKDALQTCLAQISR